MGVKSQYLPQVSYYMYDYTRTNPGSVGSTDMVNTNIILREQMSGFPGRPMNWFANADAPFNLLGIQHGIGITFYQDVIGLNTDLNYSLDYALHFNIGDGNLGIGVNCGFIQNTLDVGSFVTIDGNPPSGDPYIPAEEKPDKLTFTIGAGLFYRAEDIYFGISALNLNSPEVSTTPQDGNVASTYNLNTHYYVTSGYNMQLSNPAWELKPSVLLKSDLVTTDLDLNLICAYNKRIWGGVSYRTAEAIVGMFGFEIMDGLKIGLSYDMQTSALMDETWGGYEIMLNYSFQLGVEKAPQKYKSIRFL